MVELQHAMAANPTMVRPLVKKENQLDVCSQTRRRRTSGRFCPHFLHFVTEARVIFSLSDHLTPELRRDPPVLYSCFFTDQRNPVPISRGGSSTNPGGTVQAK